MWRPARISRWPRTAYRSTPGEPLGVTRVRWGGSLLEEAELRGSPALLTVAPHAVAAEPTSEAAIVTEHFTPALAEADLVARVLETVPSRIRRASH